MRPDGWATLATLRSGAIHVPGLDYVDHMVRGVFAPAIAFGAVGTAVALADDMQKGLLLLGYALSWAFASVGLGAQNAAVAVRRYRKAV